MSGSAKIREERMTAFEGMKAIMEKIDSGQRLSVEERADFDARNARITELEKDLRTAEQAEKLAAEMRADNGPAKATQSVNPEQRYESAFRDYMRYGKQSVDLLERASGSGAQGPGGATTAAGGAAGGFLVPPGWWQRLQVALKIYGGVANDFQQLETESGQSIQWAGNNPTSAVGTIVSENTQVATYDYNFGQGVLSAYMFTSGIQLVSIQLAQDSAFDIDTFITDRVGESLGRAQANFALLGSGSAAPLGILTALKAKGAFGTAATGTSDATGTAGASTNSSGGYLAIGTAGASINIGGNASTEVASNTLSQASLRQMVAAVDPAYRNQGAKFYMNDAQLLGLRGLTDNNGRPLINFQDGLSQGVGTQLWGYDVVVDNNIPNLGVTSSASGGIAAVTAGPIFGHLQSAMVLRSVTDPSVMRLSERYADFLQVGYVGYMRWDSRSNDLRSAVTVSATAS